MRTFIIDSIFLYQFIAVCLFGYWTVESVNTSLFLLHIFGILLCIASIFVNIINVKYVDGYYGIFYEDH